MPFSTVEQGMKEFKSGDLHSGKGGPKVTSRKQAIAISLSEARKHGGKAPAAPKSMSKGR
jgi:hypothetical protein